jgi:YggT family protein
MRELAFLIDSLLSLVVGAFLLRLLLQLSRADFRNPLAQTIIRVTNPIVLPLRRVLPPIGRTDTASVVAVILAGLFRTVVARALAGASAFTPWTLLVVSVIDLLDLTILIYMFALVLYVLLSYIAADSYNPAGRVLSDLCEPLLRPFRRALPLVGSFDLSPLVVWLLLQVLRMVLNGRIAPFLLS